MRELPNMRLVILIQALCVLPASALPAAPPDEVGASVKTTSGILTGTMGTNSPDVSAYLGIPFAIPPVGSRRWTAPERFSNPDDSVNATAFRSDCKGTIAFDVLSAVDPQEDCLYLNVWVPPKGLDTAPKPVMVWIYGGAFVGGSAALLFTEGSLLAKQGDVIVVAMNYRLSIMGFPGAPDLPDQNLGLLDQRAAVEWTRDNIAAFGGDPDKITLVSKMSLGLA